MFNELVNPPNVRSLLSPCIHPFCRGSVLSGSGFSCGVSILRTSTPSLSTRIACLPVCKALMSSSCSPYTCILFNTTQALSLLWTTLCRDALLALLGLWLPLWDLLSQMERLPVPCERQHHQAVTGCIPVQRSTWIMALGLACAGGRGRTGRGNCVMAVSRKEAFCSDSWIFNFFCSLGSRFLVILKNLVEIQIPKQAGVGMGRKEITRIKIGATQMSLENS